jgi:hypothetical protein
MVSGVAKENVKELLNGEGGVLNGQTVLVTCTLPSTKAQSQESSQVD